MSSTLIALLAVGAIAIVAVVVRALTTKPPEPEKLQKGDPNGDGVRPD